MLLHSKCNRNNLAAAMLLALSIFSALSSTAQSVHINAGIYKHRPARAWDSPERPMTLTYHTFDLKYQDSSEDRVTGIIVKTNSNYFIVKNGKRKPKAEDSIALNSLSKIEILDDIDYILDGIRTDSAWLFPSVEGVISVYTDFEGPVRRNLPVLAIQKDDGPIIPYTLSGLRDMIMDDEEAVKKLSRSGPLAAVNLYNENFRKKVPDATNENEKHFTDADSSIATNSEAQFVGGQNAWNKFLSKQRLSTAGTGGNVHVEFTVNENGIPENIHVVNGKKNLHERAIRVIEESGRWLPAKVNGKPVASTIIRVIPFMPR